MNTIPLHTPRRTLLHIGLGNRLWHLNNSFKTLPAKI